MNLNILLTLREGSNTSVSGINVLSCRVSGLEAAEFV
jgi:hypothetical protein